MPEYIELPIVGAKTLTLYAVYSPSNHRCGVAHDTRADVEADTKHFYGKASK